MHECSFPLCTRHALSNGYCVNHSSYAKTPAVRLRADPKPAKPVTKLSDKEKARKKAYAPVRKQFLKDHPECQIKLPGCAKISTQIHHSEGRTGSKLIDLESFVACCFSCHRKTHDNDAESRKTGVIKSRLKV